MNFEIFSQAASQKLLNSNLSNKDGGSIPLFILLVPIIIALFNILMAYTGSLRYKKLKLITKEHEWLLQQKENCLAFMRLRLIKPIESIYKELQNMQKSGTLSDTNFKKLDESIGISRARIENLSYELQRSSLHVAKEAIDIIPFYRSVTTMVILALTAFVITVVNSVLATTKVVSFTFGMLAAQVVVFVLAAVVVLITNRYKRVSDKLIMHSKATLALQEQVDNSKDHIVSLVIKIISSDIVNLKQDIALLLTKEQQARVKTSLDHIDVVIERMVILNDVEARTLKSDVRIINVEDLVSEVFRAHQNELNERGIQVEHFHRVGSAKLQPSVVQDHSLLKTALSEVFDNAMRYSPRQGIIKVISEHDLTSSSLTVVDQGPGLKLSQRKIGTFTSDKYAATDEQVGIGLYLADQIMHILGGEIDISRNPEGGTRVKLTFINSYVR